MWKIFKILGILALMVPCGVAAPWLAKFALFASLPKNFEGPIPFFETVILAGGVIGFLAPVVVVGYLLKDELPWRFRFRTVLLLVTLIAVLLVIISALAPRFIILGAGVIGFLVPVVIVGYLLKRERFWRFSLRTQFIAVTLIAVLLGIIAALAPRRGPEELLLAGETDKAKARAIQLLEDAEREKDSWNYGNLIHSYNILLGRIALQEGNRDEAAKYLIAAGMTPGSPQLDSFGPDFSLANTLLASGRPEDREAVLEYLDDVARFWANPQKESYPGSQAENRRLIESWKNDIAVGKTPNLPLNSSW